LENWYFIKLELGRTAEFPSGSPSRTYLVRLPLTADGRIDEAARSADPRRATVRRYWPQQADRSGYVVRKGDGWTFSFASGDSEGACHLEDSLFAPGGLIMLTEPDGRLMPFHIANLTKETAANARHA
jgi:hypothetical protein